MGLSLFDRMSSKILHSHCNSNYKVIPKESSHVDLVSLELPYILLVNYISVSSVVNFFSALILNALCHFYHVLVNFFHSQPHSEVSSWVLQSSTITESCFLKGNSVTVNVLAIAFNRIYFLKLGL